MAPSKSDGQQLRGDDAYGGDPHQSLDCVGVLSMSELHGLDATAFLHPHFGEINAVKHCQDQQRQYGVGYGFFQWHLHRFQLLLLSPMVVACGRLYRDKGDDPAAQVLIVFRKYAVFFK